MVSTLKSAMAFDQCQIRSAQGIQRFWLLTSLAYNLCCMATGIFMPFDEGYRYIQMNPSAAYLWEAMKEPRTLAQLEKTLEDAFDVSCVQATADVLDFLKVLQEHNMICAQ